MQTDTITQLRERLGELADLGAAIGLLHWDQETYMPPKAAEGRGLQLSTLSGLSHRMFTDPLMGNLLRSALDDREQLDPDDRALVDVAWYDYERALKLPETFVQAFALEQSRAYETWVKAREQSDFALFQPHLKTLLELLRQKADLLGYEGSPYNALLEDFERGMTAEHVRGVFSELAKKQSELVERIMASPNQPDSAWLDAEWDEEAQWAFALRVLNDLGYDMAAGRQDRSVHPFSTGFDLYDVRITTRLSPKELFMGLMGSIHECGHALYSQGHDPADRRTPLLDGASLGMHESQSRMWENLIGRSLPFWRHYYPVLQQHFPAQLDRISPETFYHALNRVAPSLIRVEADECTYNLHIIIRFEIEVALLEGDLSVSDVPALWNEKVRDYLGIEVPNDAQGCLQDIHWAHGAMGYFPTYALGNLYAAQLMETIEKDLPDLWQQVETGQFAPLLDWLREHIHRIGRRKRPIELMEDVTGRTPESGPYLRYLERKYNTLYGL